MAKQSAQGSSGDSSDQFTESLEASAVAAQKYRARERAQVKKKRQSVKSKMTKTAKLKSSAKAKSSKKVKKVKKTKKVKKAKKAKQRQRPKRASTRRSKRRGKQGLSNEKIAQVIQQNSGGLRSCYRKLLKKNPSAVVETHLSFTIGTSGRADRSSVKLERPQRKTRFERCVKSMVARWYFPKADTSSRVRRYPLKFSPGF